MSGGKFNYKQYQIRYIWEEMEELLYKQKSKKIRKKIKKAIEILKKAEIYTQRIDYYLSGDDNEKSFLHKLTEDLNEFKKTYRNTSK